MFKLCTKCGIEKPLSEFCKHKSKKGGYNTWCRTCKNEYDKVYRDENKEKIRNYRKKYYLDNKREINKKHKIYNDDNKENRKKYKEDNKKYIKQYLKEYRKEHYQLLSSYDVFCNQINWCEEVRRDPNNKELLQVRCTENSCRKWFTPISGQVSSRIKALKENRGESRFYCSDECKDNCSMFNQQKYHKNKKPYNFRDSQTELKELVLERDNYECQRCGSTKKLRCHHYEGIEQNPIESADIDMCITLCRTCHKLAHKDKGCRYIDLQRNNLCKEKV